MSELTKSNPDNRGWQRNWEISYQNLGNTALAQGHAKEAARQFRDSLTIARKLAQIDKTNRYYYEDMRAAEAKLADAERLVQQA